MTPSARSLALLAVALVVVTSGCVGALTGSEPIVLDAVPVGVSTAAQDDAGYEEVRQEEQPLSREVSVLGQTRQIEVTNHIAEYSRSVSVGPIGTGEFARFVVLSTPAVEVLGQTFNPVGDMSNRELAEHVQQEYEDIQNLEEAGERSVTVLGTSTTVSTFTADGRLAHTGQSVELTIHVTKVRHGDDFLVAVGVHPSLIPGEADRIDRMLEGVEHEG